MYYGCVRTSKFRWGFNLIPELGLYNILFVRRRRGNYLHKITIINSLKLSHCMGRFLMYKSSSTAWGIFWSVSFCSKCSTVQNIQYTHQWQTYKYGGYIHSNIPRLADSHACNTHTRSITVTLFPDWLLFSKHHLLMSLLWTRRLSDVTPALSPSLSLISHLSNSPTSLLLFSPFNFISIQYPSIPVFSVGEES